MSTTSKTMHVAVQQNEEGAVISMSCNNTLTMDDPDEPGTPFRKAQNLNASGEDISDKDHSDVQAAVKKLVAVIKRSQPPVVAE